MVPPGHLSAGQVHAPKVGVQRGLVPVMERIWGRAAVGGCESLGYGAGDPNVCDPGPTSRDCHREHQAVAVAAPGSDLI